MKKEKMEWVTPEISKLFLENNEGGRMELYIETNGDNLGPF